ncbi:hypothetical protein QO206_13175 [Leeuwenhoekiella aequorea]|uniref:hypothetical protein n=1 Tax=Leeuwenhoekiella aequorea TaxID=283736 RepID=UPI00352D6B90
MGVQTDFSNQIFRCSQLGKLMTGVKPNLTVNQEETLKAYLEKKEIGKITDKQLITLGDLISKRDAKPELSKTTQSYLQELHKEAIFHRSDEITSRYLDKGIQVEEKSITLYSNVNNQFFVKNRDRITNEFITGEPDNKQKHVRDIKSSWTVKTFPFYELNIPNSDYEWQGRGYMWLTGLKEFELIYCLVDTPVKLIEDDIRKLDWKYDVFDGSGMVREERIPLVVETICNHLYSEKGLDNFLDFTGSGIDKKWFVGVFKEIPEALRTKSFFIEHDDSKIEQLKDQIKMARAYMNELSLRIFNGLEKVA